MYKYVPGMFIKLIKVQQTFGLKEWNSFFGRLKGYHLARITPLNNSDSHSTQPDVVKAQSTTWALRIWLSSAGVQPVPGSALILALSGNPNLSCRFSPIHSANLVGDQRKAGCAVLYMYSSHFGVDACVSDMAKKGAGS